MKTAYDILCKLFTWDLVQIPSLEIENNKVRILKSHERSCLNLVIVLEVSTKTRKDERNFFWYVVNVELKRI